MPKLKVLSLKQQKFVDAYLGESNGNGAKAAQLAGYRGSPQTLKTVASENLAKPDILKEVEKRLRATMTADEVLQELSAIASADCPEPVRVNEKLRALELMGKHHKVLTDKVEDEPDPAKIAQEVFNILKEAHDRMRAANKLNEPVAFRSDPLDS